MALPSDDGTYVLDTDASDFGLGAILSQRQGDQEKVIAYASRTLGKPEQKYETTRKELLAIVAGLKQFRQYLLGRHFVIRTDHAALTWLRRTAEPMPQPARWLTFIEQFDYEIEHRPGAKHGNADGLSRQVTREVRAVKRTQTPAERQRLDKETGAFVSLRLSHDRPPRKAEVQLESETTKKLASQWSKFEIHDGLLYRRYTNTPRGEGDYLQLLLPREDIPDAIRQCHAGVTGGHFGEEKTKEQVKRRFYWPSWKGDVGRFCLQCTQCNQYHRGRLRKQGSLQPVIPGAPFERWYIDLTGPHPKSESGNIWILTCMDSFTKWAEAFPLRNKEAETIAKMLVEQVFSRFGAPLSVLSDQGKEVDGRIMREICRLFWYRETPYDALQAIDESG